MNRIKILISLAAAISLSTVAIAQQKPANFIAVEGGLSLPLGNFGKASTATALTSIQGTVDDPSGYAKPGGFGSVNGAWFFSKHFGIGGMFRYGTYNLKHVDSLSQGYEESFDVDQTSTTVTNYKMWSLMPGLYLDLPLAGKLSLTGQRARRRLAQLRSTPADQRGHRGRRRGRPSCRAIIRLKDCICVRSRRGVAVQGYPLPGRQSACGLFLHQTRFYHRQLRKKQQCRERSDDV